MKGKRMFTLALVAALCLTLVALAGCSKPAGQTAEKIKIGGNFELTGSNAEFGKKGENGLKMAIDEANAKGGVLGKQIEYVGADNKSEAGESTAATTKLVTQDKVIGIIGPMTTGNVLASIPVVTDNKVPLITPSGTNATITVKEDGTLNKWLFRACFIDPFQGEVAANFVNDTLKLSKAAIIVDQKGDYSKGLAGSFQNTFTKAGKTIVGTEQYVGGQDKDFRSILTNIKAKNPDVVFVPGYYGDVGMIIKQARNLDMNMTFIGGDGWGTGNIVSIAGSAAMNNSYHVDLAAVDDPGMADFAKAYKEKFNQDADSFAASGYDAGNMLIEAIKKAGSTDTEKIREALETMTGFKGVSGDITVDPATHNPKKSASILKFVDGKKEFVTRVNPK